MRLLLAGGGTGGHLFPAVALAEQLKAEEMSAEVMFVGTEKGLEYRMLPELGWPLKTISMSGWVGVGAGRKARAVVNLLQSLGQSWRILREFRPDLVVGVGGYASVPVLMAARCLGIPALIHEQNAWPGMANRFLSRWVQRVCLSFPEADRAFHHSATVVTGNPVRAAMEACPDLPVEKPCLLVFGGSLGAKAVNRAIVAALPKLEGLRGRLGIIHQTGEEAFAEVEAAYRKAGWDDVVVQPFIKDMAAAYADASLVFCRAGATTLAELTACGRPAVLVPYPHAAGGHQATNAHALAAKGAALMIEEQDLDPEQLGQIISDLLNDPARLRSMSGAARLLARRGAAAKLLAECRAVLTERNRRSEEHVR